MASEHQARVLDQFTRQAVPFATAPSIRNPEALNRIVQISGGGPSDNVLDVACGPGLLVCAFARVVRHATGIDLTPAMLDQARALADQEGLNNVTWQQGDVLPLPYDDGQFSIVSARFAFHHFPDPLAVLKEMRRVRRTGGRIVVADSAPAHDKADAFNAMELLRDPSHVRAMPLEELRQLFADADLDQPRIDHYRVEGELEGLLERSFPNEGDGDCVRRLFEESLETDALDMATRRRNGKIYFGYPVAILTS
ncbi:MAG TPA: methyltransferase domain-containing protein [Bryobacteraceae bacterium]|jgi:SAM-dependent methyltransferase|nr:methyltransferase domain-containing protein [Bryobacteraceae bacterium]